MATYSKDLMFNTDQFDSTIAVYREAAQNLSVQKSLVTSQVEGQISEYWQSQAGEAFYSQYCDTWDPVMEKYITALNALTEALEQAKTDYAELETLANSIRF